MSYSEVIYGKLLKIFGSSALEPLIAVELISYVENNSIGVKHINLAFVKNLCRLKNSESNDVAVLKTLQVLAGDAIGFLRVGFEYVNDEGDVSIISKMDFIGAINEGIDPISGEQVGDLSDRVLIFYMPDETFPARLN